MRNYAEQIQAFWPTIMEAWEARAGKRSVIECDVVGKQVRAYASGEYIDSLSERTREKTRREFARTMDEGGIMVFVLDTKHRVLQSYSFPQIRPAGRRKPNKPSQRIANPRRVGKR